MRGTIEVGVLGPPALVVDGAPVRVPTGRQAGLLALLALEIGRAVSVGRIGDELWPLRHASRPAIHVLVSRTRRLLGPSAGALETVGEGYRLDATSVTTDLAAFRRDVGAARSADTQVAAGRLLDRALGRWRGRALDGLRSFGFSYAAEAALEDERLTAIEDRLDAHLACDEPAQVLLPARQLVLAHPYRERPWRLLVAALARCGRRREALLACHDLRETLAAVGLEPELETVRLERAVAGATTTTQVVSA